MNLKLMEDECEHFKPFLHNGRAFLGLASATVYDLSRSVTVLLMPNLKKYNDDL